MSTSPLNPDDYAYGDPNRMRATIAQLMATVAMRANIIGDYAALRDDAGLRYAMRCAAAEFSTALNLLGDLTEQTERDRQRRQSSSPSKSHSHPEART